MKARLLFFLIKLNTRHWAANIDWLNIDLKKSET